MAASSVRLPDGRVLERAVDMVDVTSGLPRADKDWAYTDRQGHPHRWVEGGSHYPSLIWVVDQTYWCEDCEEEHTDGHEECRYCGEHVTPGTVGPPGHREYIPGMTSYYLDGEPVTPEQYQALLAELGGA